MSWPGLRADLFQTCKKNFAQNQIVGNCFCFKEANHNAA